MSIQAVGWALDQDLPARPKLVLVSIANHANHVDGYCWLKAETIAAEASCSPRGVFNFVSDLIRNGYIRKSQRRSDDGRQRSNDYWILFNRPSAEWISRGTADEEAAEEIIEGPVEDEQEQAEDPTISGGPDAPGACGKDVTESVDNDHRMHAGAVGPHAPACSHKDSAEPSKTKPEKAALPQAPPRSYRPPPPPPPQPVGSTTGTDSSGPIFVFYPSRAYDAWQRVKERELKRPWKMLTWRNGRQGWFFPRLFPENEKPPPAIAQGTGLTEIEAEEFARTG